VDQEKRPSIDNAKEFVVKKFSRAYAFGLNDLLRSGVYKEMGYMFNFKSHLKKYLYKQYGHWSEVYAPNKTMLRKCVYGRIDKIVEI
jgi:hypothetical protein